MNHHDETRKMLELIREDRRKVVPTQRLLTEQDINVQEEKELDPAETSEEERKFRDTVTPRVKFNKFKLYIVHITCSADAVQYSMLMYHSVPH